MPQPQDRLRPRRALLSVFDKTGLVAFAEGLARYGVALVSTGGTARTLREAGLDVTDVSDLTGFPEVFGGRVKTLHPNVHGGLLFRRNDLDDVAAAEAHGIPPIDLVVVNLYPFEQVVAREGVSDAEVTENVDIGGPAMTRAAAKNHAHVAVVTSPDQYAEVLAEMNTCEGCLSLLTRRQLAGDAFARTAAYDTAIARYFGDSGERDHDPHISAHPASHPPHSALRYGENPHQAARFEGPVEPLFRTLHGKELSYNNLLDLDAALRLMDEFQEADPTVAILKHTNPCGVASRGSLAEAYAAAFATDTVSPFGGIVVVNRTLDLAAAQRIDAVFTELVIAPGFEEGVLDFLRQKANRRLIEVLRWPRADASEDVRSAAGGRLVQERDPVIPPFEEVREGWQVVTQRPPTEAEWADLDFAWRVAKHVKSNAIVYARDRATVGVGAGQMSRLDSAEIAVSKARKAGLSLEGAVVASDAFFPFADGLEAAAAGGIRAAIQPGGSVRDTDVIAAADALGLAMVFTGRRHFRH
ncbi:MAG TPA: bifunctional phosphoribosylaminoimidazolecarboxamide formyltransferase/IMP cyclohydrolase [Rhodothermales bacterium]|nr:bifunctional phosphoribosylaminoimidazolecarboxamide formyltransferase/IMP cyclohydrolase [Rhodothermales bacterium]